MPTVRREESYVEIGYELCCGYERAAALAADVVRALKDDKGINSAEDATNGFYRGNQALVKVWFNSLADANRLDPVVRRLLSRKVDFTYEAHHHISYGSRGPTSYVTASTTLQER